MTQDNKQKWIISILSSLMFIILSIPLLKVSVWNGIFMIVNTIIFAILMRVILMFMLPYQEGYNSNNFDDGYTGLANPGSMMKCNEAQLASIDVGCDDCTNATTTCMKIPFTKDC